MNHHGTSQSRSDSAPVRVQEGPAVPAETSRDLCLAPYEFSYADLYIAAERFCMSFPDAKLDCEWVVQRFESLTHTIDPELRLLFLTDTIPTVLQRMKGGVTLTPEKLLDHLDQLAHERSLGRALPLLLHHLQEGPMIYTGRPLGPPPPVPLVNIFGRLSAIASLVGNAREEIFNTHLPALIIGPNRQFTTTDLHAFQTLCYQTNAEAAIVLRRCIPEMTTSLTPISLMQSFILVQNARDQVHIDSAVDCVKFCCELTSQIWLPGEHGIRIIFKEATRLWMAWGEVKRAAIADSLLTLLKGTQGEVAENHVIAMLFSCPTDPARAEAVFKHSCTVASRMSAQALGFHLRRLNTLQSSFSSNHIAALTSYVSSAEGCGYPETAEMLLTNLLKHFRAGRIGPHLPFLQQSLEGFSTPQLRLLAEELSLIEERSNQLLDSKDAIPDTPLNYILASLLKDGSGSQWPLSEPEIHERWQAHLGYSQPPAIRIDTPRCFQIGMAPELDEVMVTRGLTLDENFILGRVRRFTPVEDWQVRSILKGLHERSGISAGSGHTRAQSVIEAVFEGSRQFIEPLLQIDTKLKSLSPEYHFGLHTFAEDENLRWKKWSTDLTCSIQAASDPELLTSLKRTRSQLSELRRAREQVLTRFDSLARETFPLLATAEGLTLPELADTSNATQTYDYLEALRLLVDDRLPITLERAGLERVFIDRLKHAAALPQIKSELRKFTHRESVRDCIVELSASKNALDSFYDQMAHSCILKKSGGDLTKPYFQPVRMIIRSQLEIVGCGYLVSGMIDGRRSLIWAGGGPNGNFLKGVDASIFVSRLVHELKLIAQDNGMTGGVWAAVGKPGEFSAWTDEGRVAQDERVRKPLIPGEAVIRRLKAREKIPFPENYSYGPISYVAYLGSSTEDQNSSATDSRE